MTQTTGLISVVMPVWNGAAYLEESIESVLRQKANTEIVVVDDGSTDASPQIAARLASRCVSIAHSGIAAACNAGINHASGEYVLFLDQDDVLCDGCLQNLHSEFLREESLQAAAAMAQDFISPDLAPEAQKELAPRQEPYHGLMGSVLLRRDVFGIVGGFNEDYRAGQAVDFLLRLERGGLKIKKLGFVSIMRRLHAGNTGRTMKSRQFGDYGAILRSRLADAPQAGGRAGRNMFLNRTGVARND